MKNHNQKRRTARAARTALLLASGLIGLSVQGFAGVDSQVDALLSRMTLDEKIGQMTQADVHALTAPSDVQKYGLGSVLNGGGGGPTNNTPATWRQVVDGLDAERVLNRDRGDGGRRVAAQGGDCLDVGLDAGAAARIGTGDDQNPAATVSHSLELSPTRFAWRP